MWAFVTSPFFEYLIFAAICINTVLLAMGFYNQVVPALLDIDSDSNKYQHQDKYQHLDKYQHMDKYQHLDKYQHTVTDISKKSG